MEVDVFFLLIVRNERVGIIKHMPETLGRQNFLKPREERHGSPSQEKVPRKASNTILAVINNIPF